MTKLLDKSLIRPTGGYALCSFQLTVVLICHVKSFVFNTLHKYNLRTPKKKTKSDRVIILSSINQILLCNTTKIYKIIYYSNNLGEKKKCNITVNLNGTTHQHNT